MPPFRCILFAADFSERSRKAFHVACSLAVETRSRFFVLHVAEKARAFASPNSSGEAGTPAPIREGEWLYDDDVNALLREFYAPSHPIDVEYLVKEGAVADEILRTAKELGADLIAMGTHGRTGLRRLLAGSVAEAVLRRAHCPVLALSSREQPEEGPIEVILHPTDFSEQSQPALQVARTLARDLGARLIVLHVIPVEVVAYGTVPIPLDLPAVRDSLESVAKGIEGPDLKCPVDTRLLEGNAAASILQVAEETGCGMIVMGTHGRTGLGRLLMGSVAETVLREAHCPVLAVKPSTVAGAATPPVEPASVVAGLKV